MNGQPSGRRVAAVILGGYVLTLFLIRPAAVPEPSSVVDQGPVHQGLSFEPLPDVAAPPPAPEASRPLPLPATPVLPLSSPVVLPRNAPGALIERPPVVGILLASDKEAYAHDEFVSLTLRAEQSSFLASLRRRGTVSVRVERQGQRVVTIGELDLLRLSYDPDQDLFFGRWPVPWNAPDGDYLPVISTSSWPEGLPLPVSRPFRIVSRPVAHVPLGFAVLTLEGYRNPNRIPGPDGVKSIEGFPAWARFMGADAIFVQGGESSGFERKLPDSFPWTMASMSNIRALGQECHRVGLKLGVYVLCYMLGGPPENSPSYAYGWNYDKNGLTAGLNLTTRRGVSIADPKRPGDIVAIHRKFQAMPEVDWLGLDYIRPAFGSCELVDDFVAEMPGVRTPDGFENWTPEQRMTWACRGRYSAPTAAQRAEPRFVLSDQWFWYRAHRTAEVVRAITGALGGSKPFWAFTLSWNKGWEHGQDPSMMRDAGIDLDAVMLYEADDKMFRGLVSQWGAYARRDQLGVIVGNQTDWFLHQKTLNPSGPEAYRDRILRAVRGFHSDKKPARGVFIHDIHRILTNGRRMGPYKTMEWALAAGEAITEMRRLHGLLPYDVSLQVSTAAAPGEALTATVSATGFPKDLKAPIQVRLFSGPDVESTLTEILLTPESPEASFQIRWTPLPISEARGNRTFLGFRASRPEVPAEQPLLGTVYIQGVQSVPEGLDP